MTMLERLCTPLGMQKDIGLFDHIVAIVFGIVADGALQKTANVLRYSKLLLHCTMYPYHLSEKSSDVES